MTKRFERQIALPGFGEESQRKLRQSGILVIGAGGLGCPALLYLAAAGIGRIGIADGDRVDVSNLHRQVLFSEQDLGKEKASTAALQLGKKFPDTAFIPFDEYVRTDNVATILSGFDIILDGSDNFETRYLISDACGLLGKPLVFGAVHQNEGQISVFHHPDERGMSFNYRDLHPVPPAQDQIPNCQQTGVLGVLPGTLGVMMATEAIKAITGYGKTLSGKVLYFNLLRNSFYELAMMPDPEGRKKIPGSFQELQAKDYRLKCNKGTGIKWKDAIEIKNAAPADTVIIDVRETTEMPELIWAECRRIPLDQLEQNFTPLSKFRRILVFCQTGGRSLEAAVMLSRVFPDKMIASIEGGIIAFLHQNSFDSHEG